MVVGYPKTGGTIEPRTDPQASRLDTDLIMINKLMTYRGSTLFQFLWIVACVMSIFILAPDIDGYVL
ncbi:hypothetical protein CMK15_14070 [Candidatus Poribacteria bacterium]|nr:hypothetical protein [Candidatus Poribacteria bacterium]